MPQFEQHFTLAEARRTLPWIRSVLQKIHWTLESMNEPRPGAKSGQGDTDQWRPIPVPSAGKDPGASAFDRPRELIAGLGRREQQALAEGMVKAIIERGVVIQDIQRGLIDFPAWKEGREVLLCYELADGGDIRFWHDLHTGFSGRREVHPEEWDAEV